MNNKKKVNIIKFTIFIIIVSMGLFIMFKNRHLIMDIDIDKVIKFIDEDGAMASVIYMLSYAIKPFLVIIPTNILAIISGTMFGPIRGFLFTMVGFFISGTIAFYIARILGKDFVESIIGKRLMKLDDNMEKNGFNILLMLRLPPILPFDPLSYACGLTKISYGEFITASLLGVMPETICYSILGKNFNNIFSLKCIIPIIILILGVVFSRRIMKLNRSEN